MNENELMHYGVKGMKWGVRRQIKRNSRTAARLRALEKVNDKRIKRLKKSIAKKQTSINGYEKSKRIYKKYRNHLIKDISEKDIKQGERYIKALDIMSYPVILIPIAGPGISGGISGRYLDAAIEAAAYSRRK